MARLKLSLEELELIVSILLKDVREHRARRADMSLDVPDTSLQRIQEVVGAELAEGGFDGTDALTTRGEMLERLVDKLSPYH